MLYISIHSKRYDLKEKSLQLQDILKLKRSIGPFIYENKSIVF